MNLFFVNIAHAAGTVDETIRNINKLIINPLIAALFALALAFFIYGMVEFLTGAESEDKRTTGKQHMLWGIAGLAIMFSVWGVLNLILSTFGITGIDPKEGTVELDDYNPNYFGSGGSSGGGTGGGGGGGGGGAGTTLPPVGNTIPPATIPGGGGGAPSTI